MSVCSYCPVKSCSTNVVIIFRFRLLFVRVKVRLFEKDTRQGIATWFEIANVRVIGSLSCQGHFVMIVLCKVHGGCKISLTRRMFELKGVY